MAEKFCILSILAMWISWGDDFNHDTDDSLDATGWETAIWTGAHFHYLLEPDWPTGMVYNDYGIVQVPEPNTHCLPF